ncbi:MAG: hypothetical protein IN818_12505, partial [Cutibacterium sp.]|nr:hypothetical protein [Cutibacterium sp.]
MAGNNLTYRTIFIVAAGLVAGASFAAEGYGPKAETTEISVRAPGGPTFIHPSEVTKICDYSKRPPFRVYVVCMNIDANDIMATRNPSESDIKWFDGFLSELNSLRMQFDNLKISEDKAMAKAREIFKKYAPSRPSVANSARSSNVTRGGSADGRGPTSTVVPGVDRALQFAAQTQKARVIATPDEYGKFCNSYVPKTERLKSLCTIQGLEAARRKEQFDYLQQLTTTAIGQFWQLVDAIDAGALTS